MWPKLGLAFLAGGLAAGLVVYMGRQKQTPAPPPPPAVQATEVTRPEPPTQAGEAPPEPEKAPAAAKSSLEASRVERRAPGRLTRPHGPGAAAQQVIEKPVQTAEAQAPARSQAPPADPARIAVSPAPAQLPARQVEPAAHPAPAAEPAPPRRAPKTVTLPAGTLVTVRLRDTLSSERQSADDAFFATLDAPLIAEGFVIAEKGAMVRGRVTEATAAGRVKGRAALALQLDELNTADGQKVSIRTDAFRHEAESGVKGDVAKTGVAAGIGAVIGAIAGGGKGAAIGATIGGAAGAGGAMATRGRPASLPSETRLTFRLSEPVTLTEKVH